MKALIFNNNLNYIENHPLPTPLSNEALIKISLAGICNTDIEITKGYMGFKGILGHEFVGIVEEANESSYIGKRVVGEINCPCYTCEYCQNGLSLHCPYRSVLGIYKKDGAFAEYLTLPLKNLHILPSEISDEEAVFIEPLAAGFQILEQISVKPTHRIALLGDGKLGLLIAQVIRLSGCNLVVFGKHQTKLSILESIGIQTKGIDQLSQKPFYDIVIDATGSEKGLMQAMKIVKPRGIIILKTTTINNNSINFADFVINEITLVGSRCGTFSPAIQALQKKSIKVLPLITESYSLAQGIEAFEKAKDKNTLKILLTV